MAAPRDIIAFELALRAYEPASDHAEEIFSAQSRPRSVPQVIQVFNALRAAPDLNQDGKDLLVGAAFLIVGGNWWGLSRVAAEVLFAATPEDPPPADLEQAGPSAD